MARGYPDYFGYSTFFKYGQLQAPVILGAVVPPGGTSNLWDLNYKGRTYGGVLIVQPVTNVPDDIYIHSEIDGEAGQMYALGYLMHHNIHYDNVTLLTLINYNYGAAQYAFRINKDWTFDSSLKIICTNLTLGNISCSGSLWIARVT